jgi:hypothetical protein
MKKPAAEPARAQFIPLLFRKLEHNGNDVKRKISGGAIRGEAARGPGVELPRLFPEAAAMLALPKRLVRKLARRIAGPAEMDAALARRILGPDAIESYRHRSDLTATCNNDGFRDEPVFAAAYARAVAAAGWDFDVPWRVHQLLWCAEQARKVEGDIVELGTARGFFMSAVLAAWPGWTESSRSLHLFDTFEPGEGRFAGYYATSFEDSARNFAEWPRVHLHRGDLFETLPAAAIGRIAFLHIDLNHPEPEVFGLRRLWDRVPRGGIVLLDDYAYLGCDAQYRAMNALAAELGIAILSTPTGQGLIVK